MSLMLSLALLAAPHVHALTRDEINMRVAEIIASTVDRPVVLEDVLGEGPGAWDSDPRYPTKQVNCMIWVQLLMAEVYGKGLPDKTPVLDRLRYFGGRVSFGTRKHYTDHWLELDPGPLKRVALSGCAAPKHHSVNLEFDVFKKTHGYSCPLYKQSRAHQEFDFVGLNDFESCAKGLAPGYYVLFAVPSEKFLKRSLAQTGPMGLVHAIVLRQRERGAVVYHASTAATHVQVEPLDAYLKKSKTIHQGYVIYELDPNWDFTARAGFDKELDDIETCEKKHAPRRTGS